MEKKTIGIIATVVTALCCGCPGAFIVLVGVIAWAGGGTYEINGASNLVEPQMGLYMLCLGLVMFLIPIITAAISFWPKKTAKENPDSETKDEEIPPAI